MTEIALSFPERKELQVCATQQGDSLTLKLVGTADMRVSNDLFTVLDRVHQETLERNIAQVKVDLTQLEFMNSSCFKGFVSWVAKLQSIEKEQRYRIVLQSDPSLLWQRRSLRALSYFAAESVTVETLSV